MADFKWRYLPLMIATFAILYGTRAWLAVRDWVRSWK